MAKAKSRKSKKQPKKKKMKDITGPPDKTFGEKIGETGFVQQMQPEAPNAVSRILGRSVGLMNRRMLFFIAAFALIASYFIFRAFAYNPTTENVANGTTPNGYHTACIDPNGGNHIFQHVNSCTQAERADGFTNSSTAVWCADLDGSLSPVENNWLYDNTCSSSVTISVSADSNSIQPGQSTYINWSISGSVSSCSEVMPGSPNIDPFWTGSPPVSRTQQVTPPSAGTYIYGISCTPSGGGSPVVGTTTVTVGGGGGGGGGGNNCQTIKVTVCINSTPDPIMDGETSTVTWSVSPQTPSHCDKKMAPNSPNSDPNWSGNAGYGGTQDVTPPGPGSYIYVVACYDGSGNSVGHQGWGITVNPLPSGCSFNNKYKVNLASCQGSACNSCAVQARNVLAKHFNGYFTDSKGTKRHFRGDGKYNCDNPADCADLYDTYAGSSIHAHASNCGVDYIHAKVEQLLVNLMEVGNYKIGTFALCSDHSNDGGQYGSCSSMGHTCGRAVDISSINGNRIGNSGTKESNVISLDKYIDKLGTLFPVQMISGGYNGSSLDNNLLALQIYNPGSGTAGQLCPDISTCENFYTIAVEQEHENHVHVGEYP